MRFGFFAAALASMFFCQTLSHADVRTDVSPGVGESPDTVRPMTFFQLNIWEGLGNIDNGLDVFKDQLLALMPDVASFCEFPSQGDEKVEEASAEYILGQTQHERQRDAGSVDEASGCRGRRSCRFHLRSGAAAMVL